MMSQTNVALRPSEFGNSEIRQIRDARARLSLTTGTLTHLVTHHTTDNADSLPLHEQCAPCSMLQHFQHGTADGVRPSDARYEACTHACTV